MSLGCSLQLAGASYTAAYRRICVGTESGTSQSPCRYSCYWSAVQSLSCCSTTAPANEAPKHAGHVPLAMQPSSTLAATLSSQQRQSRSTCTASGMTTVTLATHKSCSSRVGPRSLCVVPVALSSEESQCCAQRVTRLHESDQPRMHLKKAQQQMHP